MLKAGFARLDVTPPLGLPLAGHFKYRYSDGVLDPIELVALAASDGEKTVLIIAADLAGMWEKWTTEIRELIYQQTGVPIEHIYIQCLHQHTSVEIGYNPHLYNVYGYNRFFDSAYYDILYRKFVDVSRMAIDDLGEARMSVAEQKTAEDISFIRRYRMKDGSIRTNPGRKNIDNIESAIGEADNTVRLVKFQREGAKDIALVNFSTHPDVIGGTKISADWPGFVRRMTETDIPNTHCIFLNGVQGDTNHFKIFEEPTKLSKYEYSAYMGRVITDVVVDIWNKTEEKEVVSVSGQSEMTYIPTNASRIDEVEKCRQLKRKIEDGTYIAGSMGERADIDRIAELYNQSLFQKVAVSLIKIGDVAFVGYGGEPFTEYAAEIRTAAPERFIITTCITNSYSGYFPTKEAFAEGGYEVKSSNFTIDLVDILQNKVKEMLAKNV